ncbi:hypothetical protein DFO61_2850 [Ectopseudomonas oleovorans]|uniref:Uncharacterized protein n=1 Tax=Ectopseudomonas oleovorans TaxID=301 RepID=A0A397N8Q8_ECTOL|nr:hypothetical protein DFO61_2850 [Pseudomonas oleovorans]
MAGCSLTLLSPPYALSQSTHYRAADHVGRTGRRSVHEAVRHNDPVAGINGGLFASAPEPALRHEPALRTECALNRYQGNQPPNPSQSPATAMLSSVTGTPLRA